MSGSADAVIDAPRKRKRKRSKTTNESKNGGKRVKASWYVGYADDSESVEAIMKKFEEMERLKTEVAARKKARPMSGCEQENERDTTQCDALTRKGKAPASTVDDKTASDTMEFTEREYEELFRRTSGFTIGQISGSFDDFRIGSVDLWKMEGLGFGDEEEEEDSDYRVVTEEPFWDRELGSAAPSSPDLTTSNATTPTLPRRRRRAATSASTRRASANRGIVLRGTDNAVSSDTKTQTSVLDHLGHQQHLDGENRNTIGDSRERFRVLQLQLRDATGTPYVVRRRVAAVDAGGAVYVRVPAPVPPSWAHHIAPYSFEPPIGTRTLAADILSLDLTSLGQQFQVVHIDPPLVLPGEQATKGSVTVAQLAALDIASVLPAGFVLVWVEKELTPHVLAACTARWGLRYVENVAWVRTKHTTNTIVAHDARYLRRSKTTCLVFRREPPGAAALDLRHQRNADCIFAHERPRGRGISAADVDAATVMNINEEDIDVREPKPRAIFELVETLLPPSADETALPPRSSRMLDLFARPGACRPGWTHVTHVPGRDVRLL